MLPMNHHDNTEDVLPPPAASSEKHLQASRPALPQDDEHSDQASIHSLQSEARSETSTIAYEQETFETFQYSVLKLLSTVLPTFNISGAVMNYLHGGGCNRVIGIGFPLQRQEFVVRLSRT